MSVAIERDCITPGTIIVQKLRHVALFLASAIMYGVSFVLLQRVIGADSPWLGLLLMFFFMGLAKVGQPLFMLSVPKAIRGVRDWEWSGTFARRCGVAGFGKLLRETPLRYLNTEVYLANKHTDLRTLYRYAASAEAIHFWAMLLFTPYIGYVCLQGKLGAVVVFLLIQLLLHVYPILHLRALRARLDGILARKSASAKIGDGQPRGD